MKVLFLSHRLPFPPNRGGTIRPFHMLRHLGRSHEVTVAALVRGPDGASAERGLRDHCAKTLTLRASELGAGVRMLARLPTRQPSSPQHFFSAKLMRAIGTELARQRYDLICVHCAFAAPHVAAVAGIPKLLDFGDVDSEKWRDYARHRRFPLSVAYAWEARKLRHLEAELASRFDLCSCTTRVELTSLKRLGTAARSGWFPNGVDTDYFRPADQPYDDDTICFLGRMDYYPNRECVIWFCDAVLPRLRSRRPGVKLVVIGADPSRAVRRLAERQGVTVTGSLADVRPPAWRAAVSIAPLRIARGTQNKILESLAMGIPVVCSSLAARGVDAIPGEHLLTADGASELTEMILRVLSDRGERRRLAEAGRTRVLARHSWKDSMRQFDRLIDECLHAAGSPACASAS